MRDGRMFSILASPKTNRNTQARPPVTKDSGSPAISRMASEPNMIRVSQPILISMPKGGVLPSSVLMSFSRFDIPCSSRSSAPRKMVNLMG